MDLVIKTSFEPITWSIPFNPGGLQKGKELFKSNYVLDVKEYRSNGLSYLITASVIRQTNISSTPYEVQLHVS